MNFKENILIEAYHIMNIFPASEGYTLIYHQKEAWSAKVICFAHVRFTAIEAGANYQERLKEELDKNGLEMVLPMIYCPEESSIQVDKQEDTELYFNGKPLYYDSKGIPFTLKEENLSKTEHSTTTLTRESIPVSSPNTEKPNQESTQ